MSLANAAKTDGFDPCAWPLFRRRLMAWYRRHRREMPWRQTSDPYCIWVSEIMLQQTQVATVMPYYERFLARFPDVRSLASADEHEVLRCWEGLGYYRRARQLHRAARQVVDELDGRLPNGLDGWLALAGIGRYTAGAIVSIAFDQPAPILEANTVRLHSRLLAYRGDPATATSQKLLWEFAAAGLPRRGAGAFNQALMELGSQICLPRQPRCERCPVADFCEARRAGEQETIPRPRSKPKFEDVREAAIVVWRKNKVLLRRHGVSERWAGLWNFPRFEVLVPSDARPDEQALRSGLAELCGIRAKRTEHFATIRHGVTRFRITLDCYHAEFTAGRAARGQHDLKWVAPAHLEDFALSSSGRQIARRLLADTRLGQT